MLEFGSQSSIWSFEPAIDLLRSAADGQAQSTTAVSPQEVEPVVPVSPKGGLGDFTDVWKHLGLIEDDFSALKAEDAVGIQPSPSIESEATRLAKAVKWRDEQDGADLEDNVEPQQISTANLRTRKRAARRARARDRELKALQGAETAAAAAGDTVTDNESGEELESLRRSPDRRSLIASIIGRPQPVEHVSPPTSPSPPKDSSMFRTPTKKEWPVSSPFLWTAPGVPSPTTKPTITPIDGLTTRERKVRLISRLCQDFPQEQKYLKNAGLLEPAFSPLNTSPIGVHVFIDMSNISIGFHDCLKLGRGIPITTRTRRIPMDFHNLSLILERGRPTAKRVLCGSDRTQAVDQAETCGYETNVLDRVHKAKTPTSKKHHASANGSGYHSASGLSYGESSGSETPGYVSAPQTTYKWSEQAVDEILHLKMSHSILDADKPSTIILATGDAAEAEYSDGFLRMVERALSRGWHVELCSFKLNTSSLYRRRDFRQKWGSMFKWIPLDEYAESMIYSER